MFGYFHFSPYTTSFHLFCYKYYIFLPASLVFNIFFVIILIFVKIITPIPPFFSLLRFPFFYVNNMPLPLLLKKYLRFPEYGFHLFILPALLQPLFQEIPLLTVKRLSLPYTFRLHFGVFPSLCSSLEKGFDAFYGAVEFAFVLREYT